MKNNLKIAIDGETGTGKSTIARMIGKQLKLVYVNSGSLYRLLAVFLLKHLSDKDLKELQDNFLSRKTIDFNSYIKSLYEKYQLNLSKVFISDEGNFVLGNLNSGDFLINEEVSMISNKLSVSIYIRAIVKDILLDLVNKYPNIIIDGRDIGTIIMPDANYKFFFIASPEVKARRRYDASDKEMSFETILKLVKQRDLNDYSRANDPLKMAKDSIKIDTSDLTIENVLQKTLSYIKLD